MNRSPVISGNIVSAGHDPETNTMEIEFKSGAIYEYPGIAETEYKPFAATFSDKDVSTGSYFAKNFRSRKANKL